MLAQLIIVEPVLGFTSIITSRASDSFTNVKSNYLRLVVNCKSTA